MVCSDSCKLAEEKELNILPTAVKHHLSSSQEDVCKLSDILNIHVFLQLLVEF